MTTLVSIASVCAWIQHGGYSDDEPFSASPTRACGQMYRLADSHRHEDGQGNRRHPAGFRRLRQLCPELRYSDMVLEDVTEFEITPEGRRITKLDQILLNGNNITMLIPGGEGPEV
ncbi:hypothetical protein F2P81_019628 [Scophthalmus maximus]|uniref:Sm domain-containing protein n=1 Tax=Scophthalmus maximus TaxID=52904 RepID=A0A6A4SBS1_SCOMX|nr:hypothetical protein F2P81_019628 [Scophthalmus maximus]